MNMMRVRPAPGRMVPDPARQDVLPDAGRDVPRNQYWMRRLADRDVERVVQNVPAAPVVPATPAIGFEE